MTLPQDGALNDNIFRPLCVCLLARSFDHCDLRYRFLQVLLVFFCRYKAELLFYLVRNEHAGACVGHDAEADKDARPRRDALVPTVSHDQQDELMVDWSYMYFQTDIVRDCSSGVCVMVVGCWCRQLGA